MTAINTTWLTPKKKPKRINRKFRPGRAVRVKDITLTDTKDFPAGDIEFTLGLTGTVITTMRPKGEDKNWVYVIVHFPSGSPFRSPQELTYREEELEFAD